MRGETSNRIGVLSLQVKEIFQLSLENQACWEQSQGRCVFFIVFHYRSALSAASPRPGSHR